MLPPPAQPKIYHITHVNNLQAIIAENAMVSDAVMIGRGGPALAIGMSSIKQRRLTLPVDCHPDDSVGNYVPFYFCSRSIMLYVIHRANHDELAYRGGQDPIVHLEADLREVVDWADAAGRKWAFSLSNAGAVYAQFRDSLDDLDEINWPAVAESDFRAPEVKEGKQAEFLVHESFPWELVSLIGVKSISIRSQVTEILKTVGHKPIVEIKPRWYY